MNMGVPIPHAGEIVGCDDVPQDWTGAEKSCLRSYSGAFGPTLFYANGFCSLMTTKCQGEDIICGPAVFGEYDIMTECPPATTLISWSVQVEVSLAGSTTLQADISYKLCVPQCQGDEDCRIGETDAVFEDQESQYQCLKKDDGLGFCFDSRNFSDGGEYEAVAF